MAVDSDHSHDFLRATDLQQGPSIQESAHRGRVAIFTCPLEALGIVVFNVVLAVVVQENVKAARCSRPRC